jgi:hypothetical protein
VQPRELIGVPSAAAFDLTLAFRVGGDNDVRSHTFTRLKPMARSTYASVNRNPEQAHIQGLLFREKER